MLPKCTEICPKTVFVISPYKGDILANTLRARQICRNLTLLNYAPFAPHVIYPLFLQEGRPNERRLGIACGMAWMESADMVFVCESTKTTEGMKNEIAWATRLTKEIYYCHCNKDNCLEQAKGGQDT